MDHATAESRLSAYLDHELSPELRADLESHLAACPLCQAQLRSLQQTSAIIRQLPAEKPSPAVLARLHNSLEASSRRSLSGVERFVGLLSGLAACLAVAGGLMLFQPANAAPPTPGQWEAAATLQDDPVVTTAPADNETAIGQWMVANLSPRSTGDQE